MPSIFDYGDMVAAARTEAYRRAIEKAVRPGDVVLDVGAGPGVLSLLACAAGASRVYAVDPDPMIAIAGEIARANGFAERVSVVRGRIEDAGIEGRVDVILADLHGVLPMYGTSPAAMFAARDRFLAPGGRIVPAHETIFVAAVESPESYARFVDPWARTEVLPFDMNAARRIAMNSVAKARSITASSLLAPPQIWTSIDYYRDTAARDVSTELRFVAGRTATLHGFITWFDSMLHEGVTITNAPESGATLYSRAFFPLETPVVVSPEDIISFHLRATMIEEWVWSWTTEVAGVHGGKKASLAQSTFFGIPGLTR